MIQEILASRGIIPIPCDLPCLDCTTIAILASNPTDSIRTWAVRLRSGELVLVIPDTDDKAWLFVDSAGSTLIIGSDGAYAPMSRYQIESRIDEYSGHR